MIDKRALGWVAAVAGPMTPVRRLTGGTHASTHLLRAAGGTEAVLRLFPAGDDAVHREARVLATLDGLDGLAPRPLAADPDGEVAGQPAILVSRLPGRGCLRPADPASWADQLGRVLARIHRVVPGPGLRDALAEPPSGAGPAGPSVVAGFDRLATAPRVLTHFDFWSGNTLWEGGRLTGVVDWSGAALAPRGFDVSWCRLDLILLYDRELADTFTAGYAGAAGGPVAELPLWDRYAAMNAHGGVESWAPNYAGLGRADLTPAELRRRLTAWTVALLSSPG